MTIETPIRIMCVDDHAFLVEGLRSRISVEPGLEFVGSTGTLEGLVDEAEHISPGIILMDIEIPGPDVFEVMAELVRKCPTSRVIVLSAFVRDHYIDSAIHCGAWGYLSKADDTATIIEAIKRVAGGEFAFGPEIMHRVRHVEDAGATTKQGKPSSKLHALTPRESQILRMIGKGQSRTEIARTIHRSPKTVDAHRASIMEKLGIHDRVELARYAIREGLVEA